ncbi:MAG: hypothetical protein M1587_04985 [Thaumarchaeota archaeon]|nr:hypothetical protein [Nitrososphaerota archaeon]
MLGAAVPIVLSVLIIFILMRNGKKKIGSLRVAGYFLLTFLIGVVVAVFYQVFEGGLAVSAALPIMGIIFPAAIIQSVSLERSNFRPIDLSNVTNTLGPILRSLGKSYVVGTFGIVLSDLFRIFGIGNVIVALNVSPMIIGAYQYEDGVFVDGLWMMFFSLLVIAVIYGFARSLHPKPENKFGQ